MATESPERRELEARLTRNYEEARRELAAKTKALFACPPAQFDALLPLIKNHIGLRLEEAHERHFWGFEPCGLTSCAGGKGKK